MLGWHLILPHVLHCLATNRETKNNWAILAGGGGLLFHSKSKSPMHAKTEPRVQGWGLGACPPHSYMLAPFRDGWGWDTEFRPNAGCSLPGTATHPFPFSFYPWQHPWEDISSAYGNLGVSVLVGISCWLLTPKGKCKSAEKRTGPSKTN